MTLPRAALLGALALSSASCRDEKPHRKHAREESASGAPEARASTGASAPSAPAASAPTAGGAATITVTLDGKALTVDHALVKRRPDGKLQLYLGEGGGTCAMLLDNLFSGSSPHLLVDLPTRLAPDGVESLGVGDLHHHGPQTPDDGATAKLVGAFGAKGERVRIELDAASKAAGVAVKGAVAAESCGDEERTTGPGVPSPALAASATLTVAGKKLPLRGALVRRDGFELTDFPRDCTTAWFLGARLASKGSTFTLDGQRFATAASGEAKGLSIRRSAGAARKQEGVDVVTLELSGSGRVGGYEVALGGTLEAFVCE